MRVSAPQHAGLVPGDPYVRKFSAILGDDESGEKHEVEESFQCHSGIQAASVMTDLPQPQSVLSTTSSTMEETTPTPVRADLVVLPNSNDSLQALRMHEGLCVGVENPLRGKHLANQSVTFAEVESDGLKAEGDQLLVPLRAPFSCEFRCCAFCLCSLGE